MITSYGNAFRVTDRLRPKVTSGFPLKGQHCGLWHFLFSTFCLGLVMLASSNCWTTIDLSVSWDAHVTSLCCRYTFVNMNILSIFLWRHLSIKIESLGCNGNVQTHYSDVIMGALASQIPSLVTVHSTVYSGTDQRKHQISASLAFVQGIHRWPVNSPHKWPVTRKCFHLMTSSWKRATRWVISYSVSQ